jgi:hypothetical protein
MYSTGQVTNSSDTVDVSWMQLNAELGFDCEYNLNILERIPPGNVARPQLRAECELRR